MRSGLLVFLVLAWVAPALADAKPPKNKIRHVELVNLNILHGFDCAPPLPDDGDPCPVFTRHVQFARVEHPEGPIDVFTTHLASVADLATAPCGVVGLPPPLESPPCPEECEAFGDTVRECQAEQLARFVAETHDVDEFALVTGDFNAVPGSRRSSTRPGGTTKM
jgi:endonuclease/exonuclease/phosphatase family metal-dependent hydrolase